MVRSSFGQNGQATNVDEVLAIVSDERDAVEQSGCGNPTVSGVDMVSSTTCLVACVSPLPTEFAIRIDHGERLNEARELRPSPRSPIYANRPRSQARRPS